MKFCHSVQVLCESNRLTLLIQLCDEEMTNSKKGGITKHERTRGWEETG